MTNGSTVTRAMLFLEQLLPFRNKNISLYGTYGMHIQGSVSTQLKSSQGRALHTWLRLFKLQGRFSGGTLEHFENHCFGFSVLLSKGQFEL